MSSCLLTLKCVGDLCGYDGQQRELTIYAVDVSPSMGELMTVDDPSTGTTKSVTKLEYGLEVIKHQVANMVIGKLFAPGTHRSSSQTS